MRLGDVVPLRLATFVYPPTHPLAGKKGVVYAFAIRHPGGVLLVDTGIGEGDAEIDRLLGPSRRDVLDALAEAGVGRGDVVAVANTHLHFDHCGQNRRFPGIPIHLQRTEYEVARVRGYTVREWVDFPGARYALADGDVEPLAGVLLLATPGHTPGHQSVLVETAEGRVLVAGHAVFSAAEWAGRASAEDVSDASLGSARRLRELRPRRVLFSHDDAVWDTPPTALAARGGTADV